jgi:hypothetical protein
MAGVIFFRRYFIKDEVIIICLPLSVRLLNGTVLFREDNMNVNIRFLHPIVIDSKLYRRQRIRLTQYIVYYSIHNIYFIYIVQDRTSTFFITRVLLLIILACCSTTKRKTTQIPLEKYRVSKKEEKREWQNKNIKPSAQLS